LTGLRTQAKFSARFILLPMTRKKPAKSAPDGPAEEPENLDKVRDILFGGHVRAVEGRLARFEDRVAREQTDLRADLEKALATLEAFAKKELEALNERLRTERVKRTEDLKALATDIRDSLKTLDKRLAQLDEATGNADADIRSQLLEQQRETAANLKQLGDTLTDELRSAEQTLRAEKADVASLLAIFSDVAVRLSEELQVPPES
jgi:chromosome segregation ATPase